MRKNPSTSQTVLRVALAGNPNSGKTTLFNALTGTQQRVGNYPGVTVEKVEGTCRLSGSEIRFIDLPGTYNLSSCLPEEEVARAYLFEEAPDVIVDVVDAANLERNLYLTLRLLEMGIPLVIALNMSDKAESQGLKINGEELSRRLGGVPVVRTIASQSVGKEELLRAVEEASRKGASGFVLNYGEEVESALGELSRELETSRPDVKPIPGRWLLLNLLEGDSQARKWLGDAELLKRAETVSTELARNAGRNVGELLAEQRYRAILEICNSVIQSREVQKSWTTRLDGILTCRRWGLPIFLALMYLVFTVTFTLGEPIMGWIEDGFRWLGNYISSFWPEGAESPFKSLLLDGVLAGVGGVLVFLPNIVLLFLAISILEDTGYMARAACLLDNVMSRFGLHGKSFIPLLIGFGCTVPAVISTRIIENKADRFVTIMVLPLFSCGARLPIYALIIPAFFPEGWRAPILWLVYCIGIVLAVVVAKVLGLSLFKGKGSPFVMELPPYQRPTLFSLFMTIWHRSWLYLKKAGTVILMTSVLLWAAGQWPGLKAEEKESFEERIAAAEASGLEAEVLEETLSEIGNERALASLKASLVGRVGKLLEPVMRPCGFDWRVTTALLPGLAAKELVVTQLGIVFALGETQTDESSDTLRKKLRENYTPLQAFCIMLFCLMSAPCLATVAVVKQECGGWRWAFGQLAGLTLLAWFLATLVYQIGSRIVF